MADSFDLESQIESTAQNPQSMTTDGLTAQAQPLPDLIAADQYLAAKNAAGKRGRGLRFTRLIGPAQCPAPTAFPADLGGPGCFQ